MLVSFLVWLRTISTPVYLPSVYHCIITPPTKDLSAPLYISPQSTHCIITPPTKHLSAPLYISPQFTHCIITPLTPFPLYDKATHKRRTILQKHLRYTASCPPLNTQTNLPTSFVPSARVSTAYFPFVTDKLLYMMLLFLCYLLRADSCIQYVECSGRLSLSQKWVPRAFPEGKGGRCLRLTYLPTYWLLSWNLWTWNWWNSLGISRHVLGELYFYFCINRPTNAVNKISDLKTQFLMAAPAPEIHKLMSVCRWPGHTRSGCL